MAETSPWIAVVDDDPAVLRALSRLLRRVLFVSKLTDQDRNFSRRCQRASPTA